MIIQSLCRYYDILAKKENGAISKKALKTEQSLARCMRATKMILGEPRFVEPAEGDYTLVVDSPGSSSASDSKDCGVLARFPVK